VIDLCSNPDIIRNKQKIIAAIKNAKTVLISKEEFGSFDDYLWRFVDGPPIINHWKNSQEVRTTT